MLFGSLSDTSIGRSLKGIETYVVFFVFGLCCVAELFGIDIPGFELQDNWLIVLLGGGAVVAAKRDGNVKVEAVQLAAAKSEPPTFI